MNNILLVLCFVLTFCNSKYQSNNEVHIKSDSIIVFQKNKFQKYFSEDLEQLKLENLTDYEEFNESQLLDTIVKLFYGTPFQSLYIQKEPEEYLKDKAKGCKLSIFAIKRNIPDAFAIYGRGILDCVCPCEDKEKGIQYILKSTQLGSKRGWHFLKFIYQTKNKVKNTEKALEILHLLSDSLEDSSATYELYRFYSQGYFDLGETFVDRTRADSVKASYYLNKGVEMNHLDALFMKAQELWRNSEKEKAFELYVGAYAGYIKHDPERLYFTNLDNLLEGRYGKKWMIYKEKHFTPK